jgi:proliferating cell nuclear antigen PCNA
MDEVVSESETQQVMKPKESMDIPNSEKYTMYLRTVQASAIRTLSEALKEVLTDVNIHFDKNGFRIMSIDNKKVAFVHLQLESEKFENYYCPSQFTIGVNMISLHKLLKTISNSDIITLYIEKDDSHKLGIRIENTDKKIRSTSKLKLLDLDDDGLTIPPINFDSVFNMPCQDFQKHCRDLYVIDEMVRIYSRGDVFTMYASGDFADQEIEIGEETTESKKKSPSLIGKYPLKYFNLFCKSSGLCPSVQIYLKENYPVILIYSVANLGQVSFGLAPKIGEDS